MHINTGDVQNDVLGRRFLPKFRACGIWSRALLIHIYPSAGTAVEWNVDSILVCKARDEGKGRGRGREGMEKWGMGRKGDGYEGIGKGKGRERMEENEKEGKKKMCREGTRNERERGA